MSKPTHQDASLILQLMQIHAMNDLSVANSWLWSDQFIPDYEEFTKKYPAGSEENRNISKICGHFETIGTLWKHNLINEELLFDWLAVAMIWERVKGYALGARQASGEPRLFENFEAMAKAATA
jgi:hypothetical protein